MTMRILQQVVEVVAWDGASPSCVVAVPASRYADADECLDAAEREVVRALGVPAGYEMDARWANEQRNEIYLDIPVSAARRVGLVY